MQAVLNNEAARQAAAFQAEAVQAPVSLVQRMGHVIDRVVDVVHFMPREPAFKSSEWVNGTRTNSDVRVPRFNGGLPWPPES